MAQNRNLPTRAAVARHWNETIPPLPTKEQDARWDENSCWGCGDHLKLQRCHAISRDAGGSDDAANLLILCTPCHLETEYLSGRELWTWLKAARLSRWEKSEAHAARRLRNRGVDIEALLTADPNGLERVVIEEREAISKRMKAAFVIARERGVKFGSPENLRNQDIGRTLGRAKRSDSATKRATDVFEVIKIIRAEGKTSLRAIAAELTAREIAPPRKGVWGPSQVKWVLDRVAA